MDRWQLETPVVFLIFNRPHTTQKVFAEIAAAKPPKLLVVADGPRPGRQGEAEQCYAARQIVERVNWDCQVLTNYSDVNLGCKRRVSSGLDWVFETVEEVIILEDDCLPHPSFFRFCQELLERYRDDERIAQIGGVNFQFGRKRTDYSYYFSRYAHIWGWASWRRAWRHYDVGLKAWPLIRDSRWLDDMLGNSKEVRYWGHIFQAVFDEKIDTWDYQWVFACWLRNALSVIPSVNLVSNVGFGTEAAHTQAKSIFSDIPVSQITFPLHTPQFIARDVRADEFTEKIMFSSSFSRQFLTKLKSFLG